jgi:hypothetical protein
MLIDDCRKPQARPDWTPFHAPNAICRWRIAEERANNADAVEEATSDSISHVHDALDVMNVSEVVSMG